MADNVYEVTSYSLGRDSENKIVFKSIEEMEKAYTDLDNGNDIMIEKDGVVVKLLNKLFNSKVSDGTLMFCAETNNKKIMDGDKI